MFKTNTNVDNNYSEFILRYTFLNEKKYKERKYIILLDELKKKSHIFSGVVPGTL